MVWRRRKRFFQKYFGLRGEAGGALTPRPRISSCSQERLVPLRPLTVGHAILVEIPVAHVSTPCQVASADPAAGCQLVVPGWSPWKVGLRQFPTGGTWSWMNREIGGDEEGAQLPGLQRFEVPQQPTRPAFRPLQRESPHLA